MFRASKKVTGGKLVRVEIDFADNKISYVKITGDFFLHPEERLTHLEKSLVGMPFDASVSLFEHTLIQCVQESGDTTMYGVSLRDIAEVVIEALAQRVNIVL